MAVGFTAFAYVAPAAAAPPEFSSFDEQADIPAFIECDGFAIDLSTTSHLVLQDVGRIVYSPEHDVVSLAGQHDAEELGEEGAVCAALA